MTNKLTIEQITDALASAGCSISRLHSIPSYLQIMGRTESITSAITSLIEAATLDANVECGKAIERQKYWCNRSVEANTELSEAWGDYAAMKSERDELRKQLAAAQNDVKQLRQSWDKRKPECVQTTAKASTQGRGSFRAGLGIGAIIDREFEKVRAACRKYDDPTKDGWIAWEGIVWGDCPVEPGMPVIVRYRDGAVSGVLGAMKRQKDGERDASVSYWFRHGFDSDIVAYKLAPKAADNDGWIEWHGGECPAPKDTWLNVRQRCGRIVSGYAFDKRFDYLTPIYWKHKDHQSDIVAYRLAK